MPSLSVARLRTRLLRPPTSCPGLRDPGLRDVLLFRQLPSLLGRPLRTRRVIRSRSLLLRKVSLPVLRPLSVSRWPSSASLTSGAELDRPGMTAPVS